MKKEDAVEILVAREQEHDALFADGFEDAILGVAQQFCRPVVIAYDRNKCIRILMERDGMTAEEAEECFEFNTQGAWVGERTPIFVVTSTEL